MNFTEYKIAFVNKAKEQAMPDEKIEALLVYAERLSKNDLPIIYDQLHFSYLVGYDYGFIVSICNSSNLHYKEYKIPKRNGKLRIINEPYPSLKEMQTWVLVNILNPAIPKFVSSTAKAYVPKQSVRDNARFHKGQSKLLGLDLVDFFGSISYNQVYAIFRSFGYSKSVSTMISNLCVMDGKLPQGSPTSPMLSNIIFQYYDNKIFDFCKAKSIRYTRYADDLSFSGDFDTKQIIGFIRKLFRNTTFKINDSKTRVVSRARRQEVTGIVVNEKIQLPISYRKAIRQEVYFIIKFGIEKHLSTIKWNKSEIQYLYHLLGKINYVLMINKNDIEAKKYYTYVKELITSVNN